ncbi:MAG: hypothetical protein ACRCUM_01475 [Mycoplasmoidaceae bacterium]
MRNKKLKKAVLTSFSIFAFTGIILAANLDNISKLQASFYNESSLKSVDETTNESLSIAANDVSEPKLETRATATTIKQNLDDATIGIIANTYPFQIVNDRDFLSKIITIDNLPNDIIPEVNNVTYNVSTISNLGNTINSGSATITVTVGTYYNAAGDLVRPSTGGSYIPLSSTFRYTNFKSVTGITELIQKPGFDTIGRYASDVVNGTIPITNVVEIKNNVSGVGDRDTRLNIKSLDFNNNDGQLTVKYTLINYIDRNGAYITTESITPLTLVIPNFERVPGPTSLVLIDPNGSALLIPSTIAEQLRTNPQNYKSYFKLINLPPGTEELITKIENIESNDKNGTISFTYTIEGKYFDDKYLPQTAPVDGHNISTTITGLNSELEKVDTLPIIIGASVGGLALIGAIALTIFFVSKAKKKKSENLRKQKLSEKVSPPTGGVSKTTTPTPSSMSGSVPGGTKPPVGPPTPGNRPVPPPTKK